MGHPLIVHGHLRWDFVWQRPQQLLSRLAHQSPVLFVEPPVFERGRMMAHLDLSEPTPGVTRAIPHVPEALRGLSDRSAELVRSLLRADCSLGGALEHRFDSPVQWFYTPMAVPVMLGAFSEVAVVYDCMYELSQFRVAPREMRERERLLLRAADVVFTSGRRMHESKARRHPNVHFFGSGVDAEHFARALAPRTRIPADIEALAARGARRVVGYFGIIDERLDYELIAMLADARPDVAIAMVGPVVNVEPSALPRRENIAWLGARPYAELPACVKGFDVCLLPFALGERTQFINPAMTLEYMAAGKPIVSTEVPDVVGHFSPIVRVAPTREAFVMSVGRSLAVGERARIAAGLERARASTWESITREMSAVILESIRARAPHPHQGAPRDPSGVDAAPAEPLTTAASGSQRSA